MDHKAAIVACRVGKGAVVLLSPHPELTSGLDPGALPRLAEAAAAWASAGGGAAE